MNIDDIKHDLDQLRKTVINLQTSHIKLHLKVFGKESKEIYEEEDNEDSSSSASSKAESNWNLADEIKKAIANYKHDYGNTCEEAYKYDLRLVIERVIRNFIQKVKEDIEIKFTFDDGRRMFEIIDKRAGRL